MLDGHIRSARKALEADLDFCAFSGAEIEISPSENEARGRLPYRDPTHFMHSSRGAFTEGFEEPATDAWLEMQGAWASATEAKARAPLPPQVNLGSEDLEGALLGDGHQDGDLGSVPLGVGRIHGFCFTPRRSTCSLKASSSAAHDASTSSTHWRSPEKRSGLSR